MFPCNADAGKAAMQSVEECLSSKVKGMWTICSGHRGESGEPNEKECRDDKGDTGKTPDR
jgi:hypothetical protein